MLVRTSLFLYSTAFATLLSASCVLVAHTHTHALHVYDHRLCMFAYSKHSNRARCWFPKQYMHFAAPTWYIQSRSAIMDNFWFVFVSVILFLGVLDAALIVFFFYEYTIPNPYANKSNAHFFSLCVLLYSL